PVETKSAVEKKADGAGKPKSEQHGRIGHATDKPASEQAAPTAAQAAPAETQGKPSGAREPRAEIAAIRTAPAEARGDNAAPTVAASPAGPMGNAPIMPF